MTHTRRNVLSVAALSVIVPQFPPPSGGTPVTHSLIPPVSPEALQWLGDDAAEWAAAFCDQLRQLDHDLDAELMQWWFAHAIEIAHEKRIRHGSGAA